MPFRSTPPIADSSPPTWTAHSPRISTAPTNYRTQVRLDGEWIDVEDQEMDCGIVVDRGGETARCVPMADVRRGDRVVVGHAGTCAFSPEAADRGTTCSSSWPAPVSSEKPKGVDRPGNRRRHAAQHASGRREDPGRRSARRSCIPAAATSVAS